MSGDAVAAMIQRRAAAAGLHPGPGRPAGRAFAAVRVRHRSVPGRRRRPLDHAADRPPGPEDARGVRPGTRPPGRQRRHQARPMTGQCAAGPVRGDRPAARGEHPGRVRGGLVAVHRLVHRHRPPRAARRMPRPFLRSPPRARPRPATQRRRLAAIEHHHRAAGYELPDDRQIRRRRAEPTREPIDPDQVEPRRCGCCPPAAGSAGCSAAATGPCSPWPHPPRSRTGSSP